MTTLRDLGRKSRKLGDQVLDTDLTWRWFVRILAKIGGGTFLLVLIGMLLGMAIAALPFLIMIGIPTAAIVAVCYWLTYRPSAVSTFLHHARAHPSQSAEPRPQRLQQGKLDDPGLPY